MASFLGSAKSRWIPKTGFYHGQNLDSIELTDQVMCVKPLSHDQVHKLNMSEHLIQSSIFPLAYSIPDERIVSSVPPKSHTTASLIPGDQSTYRFGPGQESEYHQMYRDSRFAVTKKKGGWDCLRHYEILANGCIPIFDGLDKCPSSILSTFPKKLVKSANKTLLPWSPEKEPLYQEYVTKLLAHCRESCSTSAAAKHVMAAMGNPGYNVLLIRGHAGVNYTRELTWTGIARMCKENGGIATEYPPMDFMYDCYTGNSGSLYGQGYTYSGTLDSPVVMSESEVVEKIQQRFWDCIIYGKVGPDELWEGSMPNLPLWNHVFQWYGKHEIAFFYGGDETTDLTHPNRYRDHILKHAQYANCFVRELVSTRKYPEIESSVTVVGKPCSLSEYLADRCEFYCVSYNSPERAEIMTGRFRQLGLHLNIHGGVQLDDSRLQFSDAISDKRLASVFYGHLDNIQAFYDTGKQYGFFCEDDVHIHRDLATELPTIMGEFNAMSLDILLLGYMTTDKIEWWTHGYPLVYDGGPSKSYRYHRYPQNQWGVHLFMISRSYAKTLLEVFDSTYAGRAHLDSNLATYNPDWTLSKHTHNRAIRYPMLGLEDGKGKYDHWGQGEFHRNSHLVNYREGEFL
jgi:GR25 family glycosyltransferase involved in LPS biosynthesis